MGPIWGQQDPDGPHVGPMNFAIWVIIYSSAVTITQHGPDLQLTTDTPYPTLMGELLGICCDEFG